MTAASEAISPCDYFKTDFSVNEENVQRFREHYRRLSKVEHFHEDNMNEQAILSAAEQLGIQTRSETQLNILRDCVRYEDIQQAFLCVEMQVQGPVQPLSTHSFTSPSSSTSTSTWTSTDNSPPVELTEVESILFVKRAHNAVKGFVKEFLLQQVKKDSRNG